MSPHGRPEDRAEARDLVEPDGAAFGLTLPEEAWSLIERSLRRQLWKRVKPTDKTLRLSAMRRRISRLSSQDGGSQEEVSLRDPGHRPSLVMAREDWVLLCRCLGECLRDSHDAVDRAFLSILIDRIRSQVEA